MVFLAFLYEEILPRIPKRQHDELYWKRSRLFLDLMKKNRLQKSKHGSQSLEVKFTLAELVNEILEACAVSELVDDVAKELLCKVVRWTPPLGFPARDEDRPIFILDLLKKTSNLNTIEEADIKKLMDIVGQHRLISEAALYESRLGEMLVEAAAQGTDTKKNLIVLEMLKKIDLYASEKVVNLIRSAVENGLDITDALYTVDFSNHDSFPSSSSNFTYALEIFECLIDHGARLDTLQVLSESSHRAKEPFLHRVLRAHSNAIRGERPCLLKFIQKCAQRGFNLSSLSLCGKDVIAQICSSYKGKDIVQVVEFLCASGIDVNRVYSTERKSLLLLLLNNRPIFRPCILETMKVLIRYGALMGLLMSFDGRSLLLELSSIEPASLRSNGVIICCRYGIQICLSHSTYWDMLHCLLDAGARVDREYQSGRNPLSNILCGMSGSILGLPDLCSKCSQNHFQREICQVDVDHWGIGHMGKALKLIDRLLKSGVSRYVTTKNFGREHALSFVCYAFKGDEMFALVKLLCDNGVNVNSVVAPLHSGSKRERVEMVFNLNNRIPPYRLAEIVNVLECFGLQ